MQDSKPLTDAEKLQAYAKEVNTMMDLQQKYFATSKAGRTGAALPREVIEALEVSKKAESRVRKLTAKIISPQKELGI